MIKIAVAGCAGRMGQRLCELVDADPALKLVSAFERPGFKNLDVEMASWIKKGVLVVDQAVDAVELCDVVIDFTLPEATLVTLNAVKRHKKKIVIGTTGFTSSQMNYLKRASKQVPVVQSPNMSVGVNLLFKLSEQVAETLSNDYDIEIVEAHHRHKKDAPSGTAAKLAEVVAKGRGVSLSKTGVYGRKGITGARKKGSIGVHAIRGGDVVGDHLVSFMAEGERFELGHKASSRDAFAKGALTAAKFLSKKRTPGIYDMHDVLGL